MTVGNFVVKSPSLDIHVVFLVSSVRLEKYVQKEFGFENLKAKQQQLLYCIYYILIKLAIISIKPDTNASELSRHNMGI